jgi:multidrug efflux pump
MSDRGHHGEGEHHQGHMTVPAMPGSALVVIGLFLTPVFYVGLRKLSGRKLIQHGEASLSHR